MVVKTECAGNSSVDYTEEFNAITNTYTNDSIYVFLSWLKPLWEFTRFMLTERQVVINPRASQTTWTVSPPVGCYHSHHRRRWLVCLCWYQLKCLRTCQTSGWSQWHVAQFTFSQSTFSRYENSPNSPLNSSSWTSVRDRKAFTTDSIALRRTL